MAIRYGRLEAALNHAVELGQSFVAALEAHVLVENIVCLGKAEYEIGIGHFHDESLLV